MTVPKSKFLGFIDANADAVNQRPNVKGELARADGETFTFSLWAGERKDGDGLYLRGSVQPKSAAAAIRQTIAVPGTAELPPGLDLKAGEIVLFEADKAGNDRRPDFYGYSLTCEGVNRHAVWSAQTKTGGLMLRGTTEPYQPKTALAADVEPAAAEPHADRPAARRSVKQALRKDR